jgi:carboxyl-terminal processing protease
MLVRTLLSPRRALHIAMALVLVACVQVKPTFDGQYSDNYSREMFDTGYSFISDRYIDAVSLRDLSLSGLAGLSRIDPRLDIRPVNDWIEVRYDSKLAGRLSAPVSNQADAWSAATVDTIALARQESPTLAGAQAETVFKAVFDGVLEPLDEFSRYDDAETAAEKRAFRDGFGGIGIIIRMEQDDALIVGVSEGGPAARAGVLEEDRVTHVGSKPIAGWTQRRLVEALRGPVNSTVSFSIRRNGIGVPFPVTVRREHVVPDTVEVERQNAIAVVRLTSFNADSARQLDRLLRQEMQSRNGPPAGFVLDLRSNPGGRLDVSIDVADIFLDGGDIIATRGRHPGSSQTYKAGLGDLTHGIPIVILINGTSASASEIVTAALQDQGRAIVIGTNSFGKGSVQSVLRLPNGGEITLTWSRFLAPSGYRLHKLGVLPSVCTHGGGDAGDTAPHAPDFRHGEGVLTSHLGAWRATGNTNAANRELLRTLCPSDGGSPDVDVEVARAILSDPSLYGTLLRQSDTSLARR